MRTHPRILLALGALSLASAVVVACGGSDGEDLPVDGADASTSDATVTPPTPKPDASDPVEDGSVIDATADADAAPADASEAGTSLDGGSCDGGAFGLTAVSPKFGWTNALTSLTVVGSGFVATPTIYIRLGATLTKLDQVAVVSSTSLTARVPSGLPAGKYDVIVENPTGCAETIAMGFELTGKAPPKVLDVTPATGTAQNDVPVTITGCYLDTTATVATVDAAGVVAAQTATSTTCNGAPDARCNNTNLCTMQATILTKTNNLPSAQYVVRVTNADAIYSDYASFVVTAPSGKLIGAFEAAAADLVTARRSPAAAAGRADDANRFLYVAGGEKGDGTALSSVEVVPIDRFGAFGTPFEQRYALPEARSGAAMVRQGRYLYVLGGTSSNGGTGSDAPTGAPLASIARAMILDPGAAPVAADPVVDDTAGTLPKGTYIYRVSAVMDANDANNPGGESLASSPVVTALAKNGKATLSWGAVAGAASYRVYRSAKADDTLGSEVLLKDAVGGTSFVDDGTTAAGTARPVAMGSTGKWVTLATSLAKARVNTAATIAPATNGDLYVYAVGGYGQCTGQANAGPMACTDVASISADGATLGAFTEDNTHKLAKARHRHGVTTLTKDGQAFLVVGGGRGAGPALINNANTVEYAAVDAAGALVASFASPTNTFALERDGVGFVSSNGFTYAIGGTSRNTSDLTQAPTVTGTTIVMPSWSNASVNLPMSTGRFGLAAEGAYFYVLGGTTNGTDATGKVYRVLH